MSDANTYNTVMLIRMRVTMDVRWLSLKGFCAYVDALRSVGCDAWVIKLAWIEWDFYFRTWGYDITRRLD